MEEQLYRQFGFLRTSCALYDQGNEDEAIRIAVVLRVFLHDTQNSHSLLKQLGVKDQLVYEDTGLYRDRIDAAMDAYVKAIDPNLIVAAKKPEAGLVIMSSGLDGNPAWTPRSALWFPDGHPLAGARVGPSDFNTWWTKPLVESSTFRLFSRKELVLVMANEDGGAHVDPGINADYSDLCRDF